MTVTVHLFAVLREVAGVGRLEVDLPSDSRIQQDAAMMARPGLEPYASIIRAAVNDTWASVDTPVRDGDQVALLSPVSGG